MRNNLIQNKNIQFNNNYVSIYDCFNYYQKTEKNKNYCNICKQLCD